MRVALSRPGTSLPYLGSVRVTVRRVSRRPESPVSHSIVALDAVVLAVLLLPRRAPKSGNSCPSHVLNRPLGILCDTLVWLFQPRLFQPPVTRIDDCSLLSHPIVPPISTPSHQNR